MLWKPVESNYCVRPIQPLQLKRTFREAGLLYQMLFVLLLIQCLTNAFASKFTLLITSKVEKMKTNKLFYFRNMFLSLEDCVPYGTRTHNLQLKTAGLKPEGIFVPPDGLEPSIWD